MYHSDDTRGATLTTDNYIDELVMSTSDVLTYISCSSMYRRYR